MHELNSVAVEVGDVGGAVARGKVGAICRFAFVVAAGFDCSGVGGVNQFIRVADDPEIEPGFVLFEFAPSFQSTPKISRAMPTDGLLDQLLAKPFGKRAQAQ